MSWLAAAYGSVILAVGFYWLRLVRLRRALESEVESAKRPR